MKIVNELLLLSATDVSNHLACAHTTTLDVTVARHEREAPQPAWQNAIHLAELGDDHEKRYLQWLRGKGLRVESLEEEKSEPKREARTLELMREGVDVIYQGGLRLERWLGKPDILRRVRGGESGGADDGALHYEAYDCKLARETKATAIVQLSLYSEMIAEALHAIGGAAVAPVKMHVVRPGDGDEPFVEEAYRVAEYAAYYRMVKKHLVAASATAFAGAGAGSDVATYPEPCAHCEVCRWAADCDKQRHDDDHLSLVAGMRSSQIDDLVEHGVAKVETLAVMRNDLQWKPERGSRDGIIRVREQARVQVEGRVAKKPVHELILPVAAGFGFCKLPEISAGDIYLDLEGDPFAAGGRMEYLYGIAWRDAKGALRYEKRWALDREKEREGFEWLVDEIVRRRAEHPSMHVYHFGGYESGALKHLMGYYATREEEVDSFLRAGVLVDLHQVFKQAVRASVEDYGLKNLEAFYGHKRELALELARPARYYVERRLELGHAMEAVPAEKMRAVELYNADDCFSTASLHRWLEARREDAIAKGETVPRFVNRAEEPLEGLSEWLARVEAVTTALTNGIPADRDEWTDEQGAKWLMAQLVDWHRREDKSSYFEMHRLKDLEPKDLADERAGLSGLAHTGFVGKEKKSVVHEYSFDEQDSDVGEGDKIYWRHATEDKEQHIGEVLTIDYKSRLMRVKKTGEAATAHPPAVFKWDRPIDNTVQREALMAIAEWIVANGVDAEGEHRAARDLLLRHAPRLAGKNTLEQLASESPDGTCIRVVGALQSSAFAIQGPPGSGKTYTGAHMICDLNKKGLKIGVTATGHQVIRKLLDETVSAAAKPGVMATDLRAAHAQRGGEESEGVSVFTDPPRSLPPLARGDYNVLGGTAWLWAREDAVASVDVLFVDEAGQMSLADVMAVSRAARSIVLLGDPQQLDRPIKGSHPDGAEVSAMTHLLAGRKTIAPEKGFLMPETWRLHKNICAFTSELFYEERLGSNEIANSRVIGGHPWMNGAGLYFVPVSHTGNHNASAEEIEAIVRIVGSVLREGVTWTPELGRTRALTAADVLVVAPYNKQVDQLKAKLRDVPVGTVDKFQGQEAPVAIYSLATSSPDLAPRGMEFLYSLNRLNVATSRAQTASVLVGCPELFTPECKTPRQMQLANAFCRFLEMAKWVDVREL